MNPTNLLKRAYLVARDLRLSTEQDYCLAAIGWRCDGAVVSANNKTIRTLAGIGVVPPRLPNSHAEVRLCRKLDTGSIVFVARATRTGVAMARPCPGCLMRMRARKVKKIYYTISNDEYGVINT